MKWHQILQYKRQKYGVSQNKLAISCGITRQYISDIETGKAKPTSKLKALLDDNLDKLNPEQPLEMMIDYVRIRFPTLDVKYIVEEILGLKFDYMLHEDYAFYSYTEHYHFGDVFILISDDIQKGVLLELKGKGCRQFEAFLLAQHRTWYEFFIDCLVQKCVFKRLDLAINDKTGILSIPTLVKKCQSEECISVFRSFKNYRSGELIRRDEKTDMGNTLYIGSLKSEVYFCIYEKDYEQYVKNEIPIEEAEIKNRFEIRLKNERATHAIIDLITNQDAEKTAFSIINRYLKFVDADENKRRSDWKINAQWKMFIGENRNVLRLTTSPQPYSITRTLTWLHKQVAPTLKTIQKIDKELNIQLLDDMIKNAKMTDKHEKILAQMTTSIEDVISIKKGGN